MPPTKKRIEDTTETTGLSWDTLLDYGVVCLELAIEEYQKEGENQSSAAVAALGQARELLQDLME